MLLQGPAQGRFPIDFYVIHIAVTIRELATYCFLSAPPLKLVNLMLVNVHYEEPKEEFQKTAMTETTETAVATTLYQLSHNQDRP